MAQSQLIPRRTAARWRFSGVRPFSAAKAADCLLREMGTLDAGDYHFVEEILQRLADNGGELEVSQRDGRFLTAAAFPALTAREESR